MSKSLIQALGSFLRYRVGATTKHGVHSPFVYELITQVFEHKEGNDDLNQIRQIYREQQKSSRVLETTDFGVSSDGRSYSTRFLKVSEINRSSSVNRRTGELLYGLVKHFKPRKIIEMGTSLGISTLYIAKAAPKAEIITMEGCAAKVDVAKSNFSRLEALNIKVTTGRFDTQLNNVLLLLESIDFAFIDGHHRYKPTLAYFQKILQHSHENTVIVLDDIHWSKGMEKAWSEIQALKEVTVTIDLYRVGLVFFRKGLTKQHFVIRY